LIRTDSGLCGIGRKYLMIASLELPLMTVITNTQKIKDQERLRKKENRKNKRKRNKVEKDNVNNEQKHKGSLKANGNRGKEVRERNKVYRIKTERKKNKRKPGREDKISTLSIAEYQNAWRFTSVHPYTFMTCRGATLSALYARTFHHSIFSL
jgi:hypothetical protein